MLNHRRTKRPHCMPTHLSESEALHVAKQAYERGWSNSAYIRNLVMQDIQRVADERQLMSSVTGMPKEQFDLFERAERRPNRKQQKTPQA